MRGKYLRRGAVAGIVVSVCVLVLAGGAGARLDVHPDASGDALNGGLDISAVKVDDNTAPDLTIEVDTFQSTFGSNDRFSVFIDTDHNVNDGGGGAEYQLYVDGSPGVSCSLSRWNGSQFVIFQSSVVCNGGSSTFRFARSDIGNPPDIQYYAETFNGPSRETPVDLDPDNGWWLFDDTPPETSIASGPSASTTSTDAAFSFTSTEAGSTFQCSLDGGSFAACSSPQAYHGLGLGAHKFQVRATDSSLNTDPSPDAYSWTVLDSTPPTAEANSGNCCDKKGRASVAYTLADNSGRAAATVSIDRPGLKPKALKTCNFGSDLAAPTGYADALCEVPASARGWLEFCVQATDAAGNRSPSSCKPLTFGRLSASVSASWDPAGGQAVRVTKFKLTGLAGAKPKINCHGCRLASLHDAVGTTVPPGASIQVRVVKPRLRGAFLQEKNVRGNLVKIVLCLPPGSVRPVISCKKAH